MNHGLPGDTAGRAAPSKIPLNNKTCLLTMTKMPPQRSDRKKKKKIEQEGRLLLARKAIKDGKYPSAAAAARSFDLPVST